jgi:cytochrome c biogenesis protein ResB
MVNMDKLGWLVAYVAFVLICIAALAGFVNW